MFFLKKEEKHEIKVPRITSVSNENDIKCFS